VSEPSTFEVEMTIEKLKKYKLTGTDQISAEMIQKVGQYILRSIIVLILFGIKKNCLTSKAITVPIYKKGDKTDCSNFYVTGKSLITYSAFVKHLKKSGNAMGHCMSYLYISKKLVF